MVDNLFNLGNIQLQNERQTSKVIRRQNKELENHQRRAELTQAGNEKAREVNEQAFQSSQATRNQQLGILTGIEEELRRAQEAQALARSDNPLDRVKLWALQQTSQSYSREGNQARINWYTNAANAVGMGETIRQQEFASQLEQMQMDIDYAMMGDEAELSTLQLMETQGTQLIEAYKTSQANQLQYLQTQNAMQDNALENVSDPQILRDAVTEAENSETGTVSIGGVQVSAAKAGQRLMALEDRQYQHEIGQLVRQGNVLKTLTQEQLAPYIEQARQSPEGTAQIGNITVSLAQMDARRQELKGLNSDELLTDISTAQSLDRLFTLNQRRVLDSMGLGELNNLIQVHNGVDPITGDQYDMKMLQDYRNNRAAERADMTQTQITMEALGDPTRQLTSAIQSFDAIPAAPGSNLAKSIADQKRLLSTLTATKLFESNEPQDVMFGTAMVQEAENAVANAIAAEAKMMAAGDKNLEVAYTYQLRGQPIPAELVSTSIAELMKKNLPKEQWLTTGPNGTLDVYNRAYNEKSMELNDPTTKAMSGISNAEIQAQAHEWAMQAVKQKAAGGVTELIAVYQLNALDHPLRNVLNQTELLTLMKETEISGAQAYQQSANPSEADMEAFLSGALPNADLAAIQQAHFLSRLDQIQPGLGKSYADWWKSGSRTQTYGRFDQDMVAQTQSTFQEGAQWGLIRGDVPHMLTTQTMQLDQSYNIVRAEELQKERNLYVTFGAKPENQQMFLLEQDRDLSGQEKKSIMDGIITPILQDAQRQGLNYQDTTIFLENSLKDFKTEDSGTRRLYNKLMQGRDNSIGILESFIQANQQFNRPYLGWDNGFKIGNVLNERFDANHSQITGNRLPSPPGTHASTAEQGEYSRAKPYPWMN